VTIPPIYTVYDHPSDFPNTFVVKRWFGVIQDERFLMVGPELELIREQLLSMGLTPLHRDASDDPVIVENWI
jgi:hypothetical protein